MSDQVTAWCRIGRDPLPCPWPPRLLSMHLQLSPVILFTVPLSDFILTEVFTITGQECKSAPVSLTAVSLSGQIRNRTRHSMKIPPLRIISSGQNWALNWCSVRILKSRDGKMSSSWIESHFLGVIPRICHCAFFFWFARGERKKKISLLFFKTFTRQK